MSDTTIRLGENKIIRCPEAITAMTFGPKRVVQTYYRYFLIKQSDKGWNIITDFNNGLYSNLNTWISHRYEESKDNNDERSQKEETNQSSANYLLVTGHKNGNIRFWDTESGRLVTTLSSHKSQVNALAFSPLPNIQSGNDDTFLRLISVGSDLALKVWLIIYPIMEYNILQIPL